MPVLEEHAIDWSVHGEVDDVDRAYALEKLRAAAKSIPDPILGARLRLVLEPDPARARPAAVQGSLNLDGKVIRAHVAAPTMHEAIDRFADRLEDRIDRAHHRREAARRRHREPEPGSWRHGDVPDRRPSIFERPVPDREIVRHKEYAIEAETVDDAIFDMESLDHDFFLFTSAQTGDDCVVWRVDDDGYELITPSVEGPALDIGADDVRVSTRVPARLSLSEAVEFLNLADEPWQFFVDVHTGRGNVVYRRYDGHYGLISPAG